MKQLSKTIIILAIFASAVSCKKEKVESLENNVHSENISYELDQIPILENKQEVEVLIKNSSDADEVKLNQYLYEIGLATRELIKDPDFNAVIIKMAQESNSETAYLLDLETEAPKYFEAINQNLAKKNLSLNSISADMTHKPLTGNPEYPETMEMEKYEPSIFIPNLSRLDKTKQPLISPNVETDCSQNSAIEDFIVTWYYNKDGILEEIILGEETSLSTSNPLFLINHSIEKKDGFIVLSDNGQSDRPESLNQDRAITQFNSREINIKPGYGHENGSSYNKSEFCYTAAREYTGGPAYPIYSSRYIKIKEIHPSNFGTIYVEPRLHSPVFTPYTNNRVYWNTWERDWNRGYQNLGHVASIFGGPVYIYGRARYAGDWYAWIPSTVDVHATPFEWFGWNTSVRFESWKSIYEVHKVE